MADTVFVITNDKLIEIVPKKKYDEILTKAMKGFTISITKNGLVSIEFSNISTIMQNGCIAMIDLGEEEGENKALELMHEALYSSLLDVDINISCITSA